MNAEDKKLLEMDLADTIIDRPQAFDVGGRHFYLYPVTLGKMFLLSRIVDMLELRNEIIKVNPYLEALRLVRDKKELVCKLITYHTLRTKAKVFDFELVAKRTEFLYKNIKTKEELQQLAKLLIVALTWDKTQQLMKLLNLDKEQERMRQAMEVKDSKNTLTFGNLSTYGIMIDSACERYGWTYDYVMWEISYTNLKMMLADSSKQVYLSDDELKKCKVKGRSNYVNGDDPQAVREALKAIGVEVKEG